MRIARQLLASALLTTIFLCNVDRARSQVDLCSVWRDFTNADDPTSILVDGQSIWMGTKGGLVRFDTATREHEFFVKTNSGIPVNYVTCLSRDRAGAIWVGTWDGGVARFWKGLWTTYNRQNSGIPGDVIRSIAADSTGMVWIGTSSGIARYDGTSFTTLPIAGFPDHNIIAALACDASGTLWIGANSLTSGSLIAAYDQTTWRTFKDVVGQQIYSLAIDPSGRVWAGFTKALMYFENGAWSSHSLVPASSYGVSGIAFEQDGAMWVASWNGLGRFRAGEWSIHTSDPINGIALSGSLWAAGYRDLLHLSEDAWRTYSRLSNSTLPGNNVEAMTIDIHGALWTATYAYSPEGSNTLAVLRDGEWDAFPIPTDLRVPISRPLSLAADSAGNLWMGLMDIGLVRYDGTSWEVFNDRNSGLITNRPTRLNYNHKSHTIWVGTYLTQNRQGSGCAAFDGSSWTRYKGQDMGYPGYAEINGIAIEGNGNVWVGAAYQGISRFDGVSWQHYTAANSKLPHDFVSALAEERSGAVWIATNGGAVRIQGDVWEIFTTANSPLQSNGITALGVDTADRVWIGTFDKGVCLYDHGTWRTFDQTNSGLTNMQLKSIISNKRGGAWFGMTYSGLAEYDPHGFSEIPVLFASEDVDCSGSSTEYVTLAQEGCDERAIVDRRIVGRDAGYYAIAEGHDPDSIFVRFVPSEARDYSAALQLELQDGTVFEMPLTGKGSETVELSLSTSNASAVAIGDEVQIPVVLGSNRLLTALSLAVSFDEHNLEFAGVTGSLRVDQPLTPQLGKRFVSIDASRPDPGDTLGTLLFRVFPINAERTTVTIEPTNLEWRRDVCGTLATPIALATVSSPLGCGTPTISAFMRGKHGAMPSVVSPVRGSIQLTGGVGTYRYEIVSLLGQTVGGGEIHFSAAGEASIASQHLAPGAYHVRLLGTDGLVTRSFVAY